MGERVKLGKQLFGNELCPSVACWYLVCVYNIYFQESMCAFAHEVVFWSPGIQDLASAAFV